MARINDPRTRTARTRDARLRAVSVAAVVGMVAAGVLAGPASPARAATEVGLGTAESFAVLAGETITNTNATTITGDVGLYAGSAVTGFDDVTILDGQLHQTDTTASKAKDDLVVAYDDAFGRGPAETVAPGLGGETLTGGVYDSLTGTFDITGTLTLDAKGTPSTVWIFQTDSDLITASNSRVRLINGADPCNVFWQVGSSATLGTGTTFVGTIMALTSVFLQSAATIEGRALARNGEVTMDNNTITRPDCEPAVTPSPSPSPTSPSPSPSPTPTTTASPSPAPVADSTTGTPDASTGTPVAAGTPDAPVAAGPPTNGTPQVPAVPTGSVGAGDGSAAIDDGPERATAALVLVPVFAALLLYAIWRRRTA